MIYSQQFAHKQLPYLCLTLYIFSHISASKYLQSVITPLFHLCAMKSRGCKPDVHPQIKKN